MVMAEAKDTGGAYSIMEHVIPKTIGDQKLAAGPSDFLSIPKNNRLRIVDAGFTLSEFLCSRRI